eukprot:tig00000492_g1503.t1
MASAPTPLITLSSILDKVAPLPAEPPSPAQAWLAECVLQSTPRHLEVEARPRPPTPPPPQVWTPPSPVDSPPAVRSSPVDIPRTGMRSVFIPIDPARGARPGAPATVIMEQGNDSPQLPHPVRPHARSALPRPKAPRPHFGRPIVTAALPPPAEDEVDERVAELNGLVWRMYSTTQSLALALPAPVMHPAISGEIGSLLDCARAATLCGNELAAARRRNRRVLQHVQDQLSRSAQYVLNYDSDAFDQESDRDLRGFDSAIEDALDDLEVASLV